MRTPDPSGETRLQLWRRTREFAVPPSMIQTAAARRMAGDWGGACAAARVDVDLNLRALARSRGPDLAGLVRADLRRLAPDLLRWHLPRIAPDGLLRPALTVSLARYDSLRLVARTPPAWAAAGQRISLALWDGGGAGAHPHPRSDRHFRLDLHRHLWDAGRAGELAWRSGGEDRWAAEAELLRHADGWPPDTPVLVRLAGGRRLLLDRHGAVWATRRGGSAPPVLPAAATWTPPDLELLRAGLIDADRLHPLVAAALAPERGGQPATIVHSGPRRVECRGALHRIGFVDGMLVPLDHEPEQLRREELLTALGGPPLPCLRAIDQAYRQPESLDEVRARLDHGDAEGALAVVEDLLGPDAVLRGGALHDALSAAAQGRITHGLFRAGLAGYPPVAPPTRERRTRRGHPRHATAAR
jgi:hypothetical protein